MNKMAEILWNDCKEKLDHTPKNENAVRLDLVIGSLKFMADLGAAATLVRPLTLQVNW